MKLKIPEGIKQIGSLIKYIPQYYTEELISVTKVLESENELAKYSSMNFVTALCPALKELAAMETEPFREVYIWYLDETKQMVLEGQDLANILDYYDMRLARKRGDSR